MSLAAVSLALVGCGGGAKDSGIADLSATEILDKSRAATKAAKSVHVKGEATSAGSTTRIDLRYKAGEGAAGTFGLDKSNFELIVIGNDLYLKADRETWTTLRDEATAALIGDRFIKSTITNADFAEFASVANFEDFVDTLFTPEGTVTKGETKEVNGTRAIGLVDDDKDAGGTLYIAVRGEPYPVRAEPLTASGDTGGFDFLEWNQDVELTAPPADQVLDLAALVP